MPKNSSVAKGIFLMLGASFSFAAMAAATKAVSHAISAPEIVFIRSLLASGVIALFISRSRSSWIGKEPKILVARALVGFTAMMLYFWCITQINLGTAIMLNYTAPVSAVLAAHFFFREKLTVTVKIAVLLGFFGVCLLTAPQFHMKPIALGAGLLSGLLVGAVHVLIRYSHEEESPFTIIFYFTAISALGSLLLSLKSGLTMPGSADCFWLSVVTITSIVGQITMTFSLRMAPVSIVSPFGNLTPLLGLGIGWLVWNETLSPMSLVGCGIIVLCGIVLYKYHTSV